VLLRWLRWLAVAFLHSRMGACQMSVAICSVGSPEWVSGRVGKPGGQATKRAWNRRLANYGCGD
jgi:hypothetical protein